MVDSISTIGLSYVTTANILSGENNLSKLSGQLTTGIKSSNLTDYSSADAQNIVNFGSQSTQESGYIAAINTIQPRVTTYDSCLTGLETVISNALSSTADSQTYNSTTVGTIAAEMTSSLQQTGAYLNQQVGDRYIFSGSRYGTVPVKDLTTLGNPTLESPPYVTTGTVLPSYDTQYDSADPTATNADAYYQDSVAISNTQDLTYGITSNQKGFQEVIMGLRYAYQATQDPTNYSTLMATARTLLTSGLSDVRAVHTGVSNSSATLTNVSTAHTTSISNLKDQIGNIEDVDLNEVAIKINVLEAQLQASFAATAKMTSLTILKYL